MENQKPTLIDALRGGLISGVIAAVINGVWNLAAQPLLNIQVPLIGLVQTTMASILPMLFGGILFFLLAKFTGKGKMIFVVISAVFTIVSLYGTVQPVLPDGTPAPDGFTLLTMPMHLIAGAVAIWGIPKFSK